MNLTDHREPPSADESMEIAARYLEVGYAVADSQPDRASDLLEEYFGDDPKISSKRLWFFSSVGPVIIAGAMRKLNEGKPTDDVFWGLEIDGDEQADPDLLAAAQSVAAFLNGDHRAGQDVMSAHFDVVARKSGGEAAHDAMFHMVVEHMKMLAACINGGAFGDRGEAS
ncbi:MAG TPA: hypothetical protein VJT49_16860 [Amycolatopsis sp.]|uniref:hypothetical protein n=1 Tax=Amycolatopsis sp. TaxID=37632 RepID=UPI002B48C8D1|nr:hypothetical protein [Amycolatopsis sp.]HKS46745.1 hypothetical protein [Amycolatopsis sp.]